MLENKDKDKQNSSHVDTFIYSLPCWNTLLIIFFVPFMINFSILLGLILENKIYIDQFQKVLIQLFLIYLIPVSLLFGAYITIGDSMKDTLLNIVFLPNIIILSVWNFIVLSPFLALEFQLIYIEDLSNYINSPMIPLSQFILNIVLINIFIRIRNLQLTKQDIITPRKERLLPFQERKVLEQETPTFSAHEKSEEVDRIQLMQTLNGLMPQQLNQVLFKINPPHGLVPAESASQANRVYALLTWAESPTGIGLDKLHEELNKIIKS